MTIRFSCFNCGKAVGAPDNLSGQQARCPHCGSVQTVPAASAAPRPRMIQGPTPVAPKVRNKTPLIIAAIAVIALGAVGTAVYMVMAKSNKPADQVAANQDPTPAATPSPSPTVAPSPSAKPSPTATPSPSRSAAASPSATPSPSPTPQAPTATPAPTGVSVAPVHPAAPHIAAPGGLSNPVSYLEVVISAKDFAKKSVAKDNLILIKKNVIDVYVLEHEKFPASLDEMIQMNAVATDGFKSVGNKSRNLVYVTGQTPDSDKMNILMYDPVAYRRDSVVVLRVGGTVDIITPENLIDQLKAQKAKPDEIPHAPK